MKICQVMQNQFLSVSDSASVSATLLCASHGTGCWQQKEGWLESGGEGTSAQRTSFFAFVLLIRSSACLRASSGDSFGFTSSWIHEGPALRGWKTRGFLAAPPLSAGTVTHEPGLQTVTKAYLGHEQWVVRLWIGFVLFYPVQCLLHRVCASEVQRPGGPVEACLLLERLQGLHPRGSSLYAAFDLIGAAADLLAEKPMSSSCCLRSVSTIGGT